MKSIKTSPLYLTRFVAAYLVLMVHYSPHVLREHLPIIRHFAEPVNYFFFVSGFVMIISAKKYLHNAVEISNFNKADFWAKRIARIYPMYILALLLFVLFNYTVTEIYPSIPKRIWLELTGLNRWICIGSINFPSWTISCELFFYFLFPFILPLFIKTSFKIVTIVTLFLYTANLLFIFFYRQYMPTISSLYTSDFYKLIIHSVLIHPIFKFTIFLFGCLCGRFYISESKMLATNRFNLLMFFTSTLTILCFYKYDIVDEIFLESGVLCIAYFPFILSICNLNGKALVFFSWQPFIFLGEISYGLYIMQAPIEHYFEYFFTDNKPFQTISQFFLYTLVLILCCSVLYYLVEMPAKKFILRCWEVRKKTFLSPIIAQ